MRSDRSAEPWSLASGWRAADTRGDGFAGKPQAENHPASDNAWEDKGGVRVGGLDADVSLGEEDSVDLRLWISSRAQHAL